MRIKRLGLALLTIPFITGVGPTKAETRRTENLHSYSEISATFEKNGSADNSFIMTLTNNSDEYVYDTNTSFTITIYNGQQSVTESITGTQQVAEDSVFQNRVLGPEATIRYYYVSKYSTFEAEDHKSVTTTSYSKRVAFEYGNVVVKRLSEDVKKYTIESTSAFTIYDYEISVIAKVRYESNVHYIRLSKDNNGNYTFNTTADLDLTGFEVLNMVAFKPYEIVETGSSSSSQKGYVEKPYMSSGCKDAYIIMMSVAGTCGLIIALAIVVPTAMARAKYNTGKKNTDDKENKE